MRKLLLIVLFLVGTMVYGQTNIVEIPSSVNTGKGSLPLESRGEVIESANRKFLIITPIVSATPDGTALGFNFGKIFKGRLSETLVGKFEAKVVQFTDETPAIVSARYAASLKDIKSGSSGMGETMITKDIEKGGNSSYKLGALTIQLENNDNSSSPSNNDKVSIYEKTVYSQFDATSATTTGSFLDRSVEVVVEVNI